jgi:WD40 repeat protein
VTALRDGRIVSGSRDNTLRVWDSDTGDCLRVLEGHTAAVRTVAALENGRVLSGSSDCTLRVWDVDRGRCLAVIPVSEMDLTGLDFRHSPMDEETARLLYYNGAEVPEAYRGALEKELEA